MGFEHFRAELRGGETEYLQADELIRQLPQVERDDQPVTMPGSTCYVFNDGKHVIELELMESPVRLSCRFTLCHPPSVDAAFLGLVRELMARLGMKATVCDNVSPEHSRPYSLDEFVEFSTAASRYISARRAEWIGAFGAEPLAATTNELYRRIILPQCQPGIEQPT